jgi:hypothetical protein
MNPGELDQSLVNELNAVALQKEELFKFIDDYDRIREIGICSKISGMMVEKKLYKEIPDKAKAILIRLQSLSAMIENDDLKNWLLANETKVKPTIANIALIAAAADHPLSIINGNITFEKESFLRKILELAEPEGSNNN